MAQTYGGLTMCEQTFKQVIDGEIAGSTNEHFVAAAHGLTNQLDERGRLAGSRRAVNDSDIARSA
jgi:hypothetical protein